MTWKRVAIGLAVLMAAGLTYIGWVTWRSVKILLNFL